MSELDVRDVLFQDKNSSSTITSVESEASSGSESESVIESAYDILKEIRIKNVNKIVIGSLNINSLAPKFDQLSEVIGKNLDILTVQETKLDSSFQHSNLPWLAILNLTGLIVIEREVEY